MFTAVFHKLQTLHSTQQPALIQRLKHFSYCCCHACLIASRDAEGCMGIHNPPLTSWRMRPSTVLIGDMLCPVWRHASAKMLPIFLDAVQHKTIGHLLSRAFNSHGSLKTSRNIWFFLFVDKCWNSELYELWLTDLFSHRILLWSGQGTDTNHSGSWRKQILLHHNGTACC